jgi:hypothetical protein
MSRAVAIIEGRQRISWACKTGRFMSKNVNQGRCMRIFARYLKEKRHVITARFKLFCIACFLLFSFFIFILAGTGVLYLLLFQDVSSSTARLLLPVLDTLSEAQ